MKPRTLLILACVLVLLVIAYVAVPEKGAESNRPETQAKIGESLFPDLKTDFVKTIHVQAKGKEMHLEKREGEWYVPVDGQDKPGAKDRIERMLTNLTDVTIAQIASTRPENFEVYEVDDATATHLTMKDDSGKAVADLLIGKGQGFGGNCFVRRPGSNEVLVASKNLNYEVQVYPPEREVRPDGWIDKTVWQLSNNDVLSVTLQSATGTITLSRDDTASSDWIATATPESFPADPNKINSILGRLTRPYATDVLVGATDEMTGLDQPAASVVLSVSPPKTYTLVFGNEHDNARFARTDSRPQYVYKLSSFSYFNDVFKPSEEWRRPTPTPTPVVTPTPTPEEGEAPAQPGTGEAGEPEGISIDPSGMEINVEGAGVSVPATTTFHLGDEPASQGANEP